MSNICGVYITTRWCSLFCAQALYKMSYLKLKSFLHFSIKKGQITYFFMPMNRTLASFICHVSFSSRTPGCSLNPVWSWQGGDHIIFKCVEGKLAVFINFAVQMSAARTCWMWTGVNPAVRLPFTPAQQQGLPVLLEALAPFSDVIACASLQ